MYFITEQDPNYTIKGSRDPLGFQMLWSEAGRRLIPYLSTVSANVKDFQILCLAFALQKELQIADRDFESFFLRFEQLMAYTRYMKNPDHGFNGVDKVKKIMTQNPASVKISNSSADQILSNQKAYGIWGKYIRPFKDMNINNTPEFERIYLKKIQFQDDFMRQVVLLKKKSETDVSYVQTEKLRGFSALIDKPGKEEKIFFTDKLLQDTCDNELIRIFTGNPDLRQTSNFYVLLDQLSASSVNSNFINVLKYMKNIEKVLSPLNHVFRYLQTKSYWKFEELESDEAIKAWRNTPVNDGFNETSKTLAALLQRSNTDLVKGLILRNEEVSARRNSAPWIRLTNSGIEINHLEGAFFSKDYNPERQNDNWYFLSSFLSIYKQLN